MSKSIVSYGEYHEEKDINDISISGPSINIPEGLYRNGVNVSIETTELATPNISVDENGKITATVDQSAGYVDDDTSSTIHQLAVQAAQTITPGTTDKVIAAARYLTGVQTIKGDANLLPENIIAGKSIFGVDGEFSLDKMQLCVSISGKNTVTATKDDVTVQAFGNSDTFGFMGLTAGTWTITSTNGSYVQTSTVDITDTDELKFLNMFYVSVPVFTYSGSYTIVDDSGNVITNPSSFVGNWRIKFTTGGTLKISALNSAADGIDVFLVGGGGSGGSNGYGGGGGGRTKTERATILANTNITVVVGAGGNGDHANGGSSSFDGISVSGGNGGASSKRGGAGGSGGGASVYSHSSYSHAGAGGTNGGNGGNSSNNDINLGAISGGAGQGTSTREFWTIDQNANATQYSGGGGGYGQVYDDKFYPGAGGNRGGGSGAGSTTAWPGSGSTNTGGGGGAGFSSRYGNGGSGIVILLMVEAVVVLEDLQVLDHMMDLLEKHVMHLMKALDLYNIRRKMLIQ